MAKAEPLVWKSKEGRQKQVASLLESLPRLPLEHQERLSVTWKGSNLQIRMVASWSRARVEIPGEWEGEVPSSIPKLSIVRPTWQTFLATCADDPVWKIHSDKIVWQSGFSSASVPLEVAESVPAIGTSKPTTVFGPDLVKSFRGLLPVAPRDYIQLELHGVLVGKGFLASTDGLALAFVPKVQCDHEILIPSEVLAWSDSLPGCKLGVCENSFVVFSEGVLVEQAAFAKGKVFPIDRVLDLRKKMGAAKLTGVVLDSEQFLEALKRVSEWRMAGGTKLRLWGQDGLYRIGSSLSDGSLMTHALPSSKTAAIDFHFDGKNLLLWLGIAQGLEKGPVMIATGDKLPYLIKRGSTELYLVKPG